MGQPFPVLRNSDGISKIARLCVWLGEIIFADCMDFSEPGDLLNVLLRSVFYLGQIVKV